MTLAAIRAARERLAPYLDRTPLPRSNVPSLNAYLKLETQQPTGSFKVRPALNGMLTHLEQAREQGVVTSSSGNFAQAVGWASNRLGVDAQVVMMSGASAYKRERTEVYATVVECENTFAARWETTDRIVAETGRLLLHPYDSDETVAADGTIGLELLDQIDGDFSVLVPISGGGLIGGIAAAVKESRPGCRVVGVQAEANPSMRRSLDTGEIATTKPEPSWADALSVATPGERGFELVRKYVDDVVLVAEDEMAEAMRLLAVEQKLVVEGGGAVGAAAILAGKADAGGPPLVCVLSGGNILPSRLGSLLS